jgi:hypothetical protein
VEGEVRFNGWRERKRGCGRRVYAWKAQIKEGEDRRAVLRGYLGDPSKKSGQWR